MRRILLVLLGFGVFAGYGSAIASARYHRNHCNWDRERFERFEQVTERRDAPAATAAPQTVVVPQAAPAPAAPAPTVFVITVPTGQAAPAATPQIITVPVPTPMPAAAPTPAAAPAPTAGQ